MSTTRFYYTLPESLAQDISEYARAIREFRAGGLSEDQFRPRRAVFGVYEQRQSGRYMLRIRVAGGCLTPVQVSGIAKISRRYAGGRLHVTTRQDIQLHHLEFEATPEIMRELQEIGLTSKGGCGDAVRNVMSCEYAGVCPHEPFDVTPYTNALTEYLIAQPGSYQLPRKFKLALSGCRGDCAFARVTDIGFIAELRGGEPGFQVWAGGGMGARSRLGSLVHEWVAAREVLQVAESFKRIFDRHGDRSDRKRARFRFVFDRLPLEQIRAEALELQQQVAAEGVPLLDIRTEVVEEPRPVELGARVPYLRRVEGFEVLEQRQSGLVAIRMGLPLGWISADDFERLGCVAGRYSQEGGLRTTRRQGVAIRGVEQGVVDQVVVEMRLTEAGREQREPIHRVVVCAGAGICRLGICNTDKAAMACAERLRQGGIRDETIADFPLHINGCPNACGHHPMAALGFSGCLTRVDGEMIPAYMVFVGGRCDAGGVGFSKRIGKVTERELPELVLRMAELFESGRGEGESLWSFIDRSGIEYFQELLFWEA